MAGPDLVFVLTGARGAAGRMHGRIHQALHHKFVEFDIRQAPPPGRVLRQVPWDEAIMDICTPTAAHPHSMSWGYARGVRRFLVEKPAAPSLADWQRQVATMRDAQIFVLHPYLYSKSYRIATEAVTAVNELTTTFDKDRRVDDAMGRGASPDGRLPHLFQVEAPHQFAMAQAAVPDLRVATAEIAERAPRGTAPDAAVAGRVTLRDPGDREVRLSTDLRAPRRRTLRLRDRDGGQAVVRFPTGSDLVARVWTTGRDGHPELVFEGVDDLLRNAIVAATESFRQGAVPEEASPRFAAAVLGHIDEAIGLSEWVPPDLPEALAAAPPC
jgi:predicted dehydrogenase